MAPQEGWDGSAHAAVWVTAIGAMLGDIMAVIDRFWLRKRSKETDVEMGEGTSWFHDQLERHEELSDRFRQKERDWDKSFGEMRRSWARKIDELDRELRDLRAMKRQWAEMRAAVSRNGQGEVADAFGTAQQASSSTRTDLGLDGPFPAVGPAGARRRSNRGT